MPKRALTQSENQALMVETLDYEGWRLIFNEMSRTILKIRQRIFDNSGNIVTDVETLRALKIMFYDVYNAAGLDVPPHIDSLFK